MRSRLLCVCGRWRPRPQGGSAGNIISSERRNIGLRVSNLSWREPFRILCGGCVVEFGVVDLKGR